MRFVILRFEIRKIGKCRVTFNVFQRRLVDKARFRASKTLETLLKTWSKDEIINVNSSFFLLIFLPFFFYKKKKNQSVYAFNFSKLEKLESIE